MKHLKHHLVAASFALIAGTSQATTVLPDGSLFDLGNFAAGTYALTGSGLIDLCGNDLFTMRPDGLPNTSVTCGNYGSYFNPGGSYVADGELARAGLNAKFGALIGTLNAGAFTGNNPTPAQAADWFLIGYSANVTLPVAGNIYASVSDTFYPGNTGAFNVAVVPEPASMLMMLTGLGLMGFAVRRKHGA